MGSCKFKGCLSEIMHVDQGASVGMRLICPLPLVLHTQVQLLLSESDGDKLTGEVLVSTRLSNRTFPYSISTSLQPNPNHTMSLATVCVPLGVASVDVDRIAREMDFQALQQNIMNVTFCNIQSEVKLLYVCG